MCQECIGVKEVHLHENYDSWIVSNDICVLILESEATLGSNVGTIPLPESGEEYEAGTECQVIKYFEKNILVTWTLEKFVNLRCNFEPGCRLGIYG